MKNKFARICDFTKEAMNSGWCFGDGEKYAKYEDDAIRYAKSIGYENLQLAFDDDAVYWTMWDDEPVSQEEQMRLLFDVYYKECPNRKIEYTAQEINQSWIVMNGIELSYMLYQNEYQPIFMCARYCEGYSENVYYFKSYSECEKVWLMDESELKVYIESLFVNP